MKQDIFSMLDAHRGKDYITSMVAIYELVHQRYGLSRQEFHAIFLEWFNS